MYTWIENTFGVGDGLARGLAFAVSLAVVLALFALFVFIVKRLAGSRISSVRSRQPRLAIMDTASVDTRRRLVLVRRDNVEHLLMIGGPSDVVVEQGIVRGTPVAATHPRPQPVLQTIGGQLQNGDTATPAEPAPAQLIATAQAPHVPEPPAPAEPAQSPAVQSAAVPTQTAANTVVAPEPAATKGVSSLRARLAELKKTPNPFGDKKAAAPQEPAVSPQPVPTRPDPRPLQASQNEPARTNEPQPASPANVGSTPSDKPGPTAVQPRVAPRPVQSRVSTSSLDRKVTPPSSGPAANARTVVRPDTRRGPAAGTVAAAPAVAAAKAPAVEMQGADVKPATAVQTEKAQASSPAIGIAETKAASPAAATSAEPKPDVQETSSAAPTLSTAATGPGKAGTPTMATVNQNGSASAAKAPSEAPGSQDGAAEKLEADADKATAETGKPAEGNGTEAKPDSANAAGDAEQAGEKPETASKSQATSETPSQTAEKQADKEQTDPGAESNPIEDEMAKLLDEIHGTQKT